MRLNETKYLVTEVITIVDVLIYTEIKTYQSIMKIINEDPDDELLEIQKTHPECLVMINEEQFPQL